MNDCERHEMLISAWFDGEIDRADQGEMLDHLVRCPRCREFYLDARALAVMAAATCEPAAAQQPSPELWERIEQAALPPDSGRAQAPVRAPARRFPAGALAAAAAAILVVLGAFVYRPWRTEVPPPTGAAIRIGEDAGRMNDARFVELTAEVLRADRRYRAAFYEVMRQVVQDTADNESSADVRHPEGGRRDEAAAPATRGSRS